MQHKNTTWSSLEVKKIGNNSVLTGSLVLKPLKIFSLQRDSTCQIVFSNYGGGYLEADQICLRLHCLPNTSTLLSSQANTRIYKSISGGITRQTMEVTQEENTFVAYLGDALVPQKDSIFEQKFHWKLGKNSSALFVDWFQAGRILNGERFAFQSFSTELKIEQEGKPLVHDRFIMDPGKTNVNSPAAFSDHNSYVNVFLVGNENLEKVRQLEGHLRAVAHKHFQEERPLRFNEFALVGSAVKVNENVFMIRCAAKENELLSDFVRDLTSILESPELLGFYPAERKY